MGAYKLTQRKQNTGATEQSLEKILFKILLQDSIKQYYEELEISKSPDLRYLQNCLFIKQKEINQKLANFFADSKHCPDSHNQIKSKKIYIHIHVPMHH